VFDEFNRISTKNLSIISTSFAEFEEKKRKMVADVSKSSAASSGKIHHAYFVTMNPMSKTMGRYEMPDNIKSFFRQIKLTLPDVSKISEIFFELNGFDKPKEMAKKLSTVYTALSHTLDRDCYDWTLRSVKQVLIYASAEMQSFLRDKKEEVENNKDLLKQESQALLLRAIHFIVKPTIKGIDLEFYHRIVNTCFMAEQVKKYER
jgi:hypothetical protein